jgi:hypothetical protein
MKEYPRIYAMLKRYGHSPIAAITIVIEAHRGSRHALQWIRQIRNAR